MFGLGVCEMGIDFLYESMAILLIGGRAMDADFLLVIIV